TREAGIATFRTPETCADALASALRRRPPRRIVGCVGGVDVAPLVGLGAGQAPLAGSLEMVAVLGAPPPASATIPVKDIYAAHEMSASISYPAVAKIVSSDILHKTEAGGVFVGAGNAMELAEACAAMVRRVGERRPDAALEAVTLETQEMGLTEAIVGYRVDPADDPAVTVGAGGVLAEIYRDVAMRPAPVNRREAQEMIGEVRAFAAICGYRSLPLGDVEALAGVVEAISRLACVTDVQVQEAEINPVLVKPEGAGVVSLDALFVIGDRG
ncbi:acetate--CoA ligase family protein, partial [Pontitalea aquivivens]|uniref:acetate--CoA ligase family protein n=1 Tax=Pontitalea aquivivens TaxID=3388663 RepID=UPI0039706806